MKVREIGEGRVLDSKVLTYMGEQTVSPLGSKS
jgi:hypothetical protein